VRDLRENDRFFFYFFHEKYLEKKINNREITFSFKKSQDGD